MSILVSQICAVMRGYVSSYVPISLKFSTKMDFIGFLHRVKFRRRKLAPELPKFQNCVKKCCISAAFSFVRSSRIGWSRQIRRVSRDYWCICLRSNFAVIGEGVWTRWPLQNYKFCQTLVFGRFSPFFGDRINAPWRNLVSKRISTQLCRIWPWSVRAAGRVFKIIIFVKVAVCCRDCRFTRA